MKRDVVIVLGKTGYGKTWWSRMYARGFKRVLAYDPLASFEVQYKDVEEIYDDVVVLGESQYRYGIAESDDVELLGSTAMISGKNLLVLEEMSTVIGKGQRLPRWLSRIVFLGRHQAVSMLAIAQRASSIPIDLRSQANRIITFQQHEQDDLKWLASFFGKDRVKQMPSLPRFTCFDYSDDQITEYSIRPGVKKMYGINLQ